MSKYLPTVDQFVLWLPITIVLFVFAQSWLWQTHPQLYTTDGTTGVGYGPVDFVAVGGNPVVRFQTLRAVLPVEIRIDWKDSFSTIPPEGTLLRCRVATGNYVGESGRVNYFDPEIECNGRLAKIRKIGFTVRRAN